MSNTLTKTQQLIINTIAKQGGSLGETQVNQNSLQSLIGNGYVTGETEGHTLTEEGWELADIPQAPSDGKVKLGESDPVVEIEEIESETVEGERVEFYLELGRAMTVTVGQEKGRALTRTLPAGTRCFVVGNPTEDILRGNKGRILWYTVAVPETDITFLVGRNDGNPRRPSIHKLFKYNFDDDVEEVIK